MVATIAQLPAEVAVAIASWLRTPRELVSLALASKTMVASPFCTICLRRQVRIHVPSDRACHEWLAREAGPPLLEALPVGLSIALCDKLPELHERILNHVETLVVQLAYHHTFEKTLGILGGISVFANLTALQLDGNTDMGFSVSLQLLADSAPRLHSLRIHRINVRIEDVAAVPQLQHLRVLKVGGVSGNVDVTQVARICPNLQELNWGSSSLLVTDPTTDCWPPLRSLCLRSDWHAVIKIVQAVNVGRLPTLKRLTLRLRDSWSWRREHHPQLPAYPLAQLNFEELGIRGYPLRELDVPLLMTQVHWSTLASLQFLRILRLNDELRGDFADYVMDDATPLASLPLLEELSFGLSRAATSCRALRALIEYTPRLVRFQCMELLRDPEEHRTFHKRDDSDDLPPPLECLRKITISERNSKGVSVTLNAYALALIEKVPVVSLMKATYTDRDLERIYCSTNLVSFTAYSVERRYNGRWDTSIWPHVLANIARITTLRGWCEMERFPWNLRGAIRLRVLEIRCASQAVVDAIGRWAHYLVSLEELDIGGCKGYWFDCLVELPRLRLVELPAGRSCSELRDGIRRGKLQQLRGIIHGNDNCLNTGKTCYRGKQY